MANYKVVFRDDNPAWQHGFPLKIEVVQVARDTETQRTFLQIKVRNVSNERIEAVGIDARVTSSDDSIETASFSTLDAGVVPGGVWTPDAHELANPDVVRADAVVVRAGNMRSFEPAEIMPQQIQLSLSTEAMRAREAELTAAGIASKRLIYRLHEGDGWWICSCGMLNVGRDTCVRCKAPKKLLEKLDDEEWLEERDRELKYQKASGILAANNASKMKEAQNEFEGLGDYRDSAELAKRCADAIGRTKKRTKTLALAALGAVVVCVAAFLIATKIVIPQVKYNEALALYEDGSYEAAYEAFGETVHSNAEEMRIRCAEAQGYIEEQSGNTQKALEWFRVAGNQEAIDDLYRKAVHESQYRISAGAFHTVGLHPDGTVIAAGNNTFGQCEVSDWTDIVAVSAGWSHTVGLRSDGTVVATGENNLGQCDVSGWTDIVAISANGGTVGLRSDGTVVYAGANDFGQGNVSNWTDIVAVSTGTNFTVGLRSDGTVVATGYNERGECNVASWTDIVAISAGANHTVGLRADGTVVATGYNEGGRLNVSDWTDVIAISAGGYFTIGLKSDGTVLATHVKLSSSWEDAVAISAGTYHFVGLRPDGYAIVFKPSPDYDEGQGDIKGWCLNQ